MALKDTYFSIKIKMPGEKSTHKKMINSFVSHMTNLTFSLFSIIMKAKKKNTKCEILKKTLIGTLHSHENND